MTTDDVYQFFGSGWKASCAIGITKSGFSKWIARGYIPFDQQKKIEKLTKGKLTARKEDAKKSSDKAVELAYFPDFRYYDKKHGLSKVESLHFRKGKAPKITYKIKGNTLENFTSFEVKNLMQAVNLVDCEGHILYEGDIVRLKSGKKFTFEKIEMLDKLKTVKFKIIGNIFQ